MKQRCPIVKVKLINTAYNNYDGQKETLQYVKEQNRKLYKLVPSQIRKHAKEKKIA